MISRSTIIPVAVAAVFTLSACGGASDSSPAPTDPPSAEAGPDTTVDAAAESVVDAPAETSADAGAEENAGDGGCDNALSAEEIDSVLGTSVEIKGSGQVCQYIFASDSVGTLQAFTGSKADEAMGTLLPKFLADESSVLSGVVFADDRGYVDPDGALVRGDSGQVFSLGIPNNIDVADKLEAVQELADLLLTR